MNKILSRGHPKLKQLGTLIPIDTELDEVEAASSKSNAGALPLRAKYGQSELVFLKFVVFGECEFWENLVFRERHFEKITDGFRVTKCDFRVDLKNTI